MKYYSCHYHPVVGVNGKAPTSVSLFTRVQRPAAGASRPLPLHHL